VEWSSDVQCRRQAWHHWIHGMSLRCPHFDWTSPTKRGMIFFMDLPRNCYYLMYCIIIVDCLTG
jgi:hypothetical protein